MVRKPIADSFEDGTIKMRPRVMQHHTGEDTAGRGIKDRRLLAQKIGQYDDSPGARGDSLRFSIQNRQRGPSCEFAREPLHQRAAGSHAATDEREIRNILIIKVEFCIRFRLAGAIENVASSPELQQYISILC